MNSLRVLPHAKSPRGAYIFGDAAVVFDVHDDAVVEALQRILGGPEMQVVAHDAYVTVGARDTGTGWQIHDEGIVVRGLSPYASAPYIAEALLEAACNAVAEQTQTMPVSGAVLFKDGKTVALLGDDLDSARVIGLHLHARGWTAVALRFAFLRLSSMRIVGLESAACVNSSSIEHIPPRYRRAVEASAWYDTGFDLSFYSVAPLDGGRKRVASTTLTHVVVVDGEIDDNPSLDPTAGGACTDAISRHPNASHVHVARLTLGVPVASANLIERWVCGAPAAQEV